MRPYQTLAGWLSKVTLGIIYLYAHTPNKNLLGSINATNATSYLTGALDVISGRDYITRY